MLYEYKCKKCGHVQEDFRRVADRDHPAVCKECGGESEHIMSNFAHNIKYYKRLYGKRIDSGLPGLGG